MDAALTQEALDELVAKVGAMSITDQPSLVEKVTFGSLQKKDSYPWLRILGINSMPRHDLKSEEKLRQKLRVALWDVQRIGDLFPGSSLSGPPLPVNSLKSWEDWRKPQTIYEKETDTSDKLLHELKEEDKHKPRIYTHFGRSAFTQEQTRRGVKCTISNDTWTGVRSIMGGAAVYITEDDFEYSESPFLSYASDEDSDSMVLLMEILDVKECPCPEYTEKYPEQLDPAPIVESGINAEGPLSLIEEPPTFPMVIVRYSLIERIPKTGTLFTRYLQRQMQESMPDASATKAEHAFNAMLTARTRWAASKALRVFARLLSLNSTLLGSHYVEDMQSSRGGFSPEVAKETNIGFFVPCLRMRWRAKAEIDRGLVPNEIRGKKCKKCGKETQAIMCPSCKSLYYCSKECLAADRPIHKDVCKLSERLYFEPHIFNEKGEYYISARTYAPFEQKWGFALRRDTSFFSGTYHVEDLSTNEYGLDQFLVSVMLPKNYSIAGRFKGQTAILWDRRRTLSLRSGPGEPVVMKEWGGSEYKIPFHASGHQEFTDLVRSQGLYGELMFFWAQRIGDCISLDLEDYPDPRTIRWR